MHPMMYQSETYICWYLRVAMVPKILMPNMIQAITTRTSSGSGSSAYSRPWVWPPSKAKTAPRMMTFHHEQGDPDGALKAAAVRVDATYTTAFVAPAALETRAAVADRKSVV